MKRYLLFLPLIPVLAFLSIATIGGKQFDVAGSTVWMSRGFVLPFAHGLFVELAVASLLVAFVTKK